MDKSGEIEEREIEERESQVEKLEANQEEFDSLPENYKLAEKIHNVTCTWNHTDGCGWFYENWKGELRDTRKRYVEKADRVLKKVPYEMAAKTLDNI